MPPAHMKKDFSIELYDSKSNKTTPFIVNRKVFPDEHEGILYTFKGEIEFTIHMIDNGLYKIMLPGVEPFEIDMIDYFIQLDKEKIQSGKQVLSGPPGKKEAVVITLKDNIYIISGLADKAYRVTIKEIKSPSQN